MTDPLPTLDQLFPVNFILGAVAIFTAVFIIPSLYWVWSERRNTNRRRYP